MKQMNLGENGFERKTKRTRKREFLDEMNLVVPWGELVSLIAPHAPAPGAKGGRPPFAVETMLRIHFLQQWFNLSDPAMEEALYDTPMFREFAGLDAGEDRLPDESTILRFRHLLEAHNLSLQILATVNATLGAKGLLLKSGTVVDATLIAAPSCWALQLRSTQWLKAMGSLTSNRQLARAFHLAQRKTGGHLANTWQRTNACPNIFRKALKILAHHLQLVVVSARQVVAGEHLIEPQDLALESVGGLHAVALHL